MTNKYQCFTDGELRSAIRQVEEAKSAARVPLLQWQEKMEKQLAEDILINLEVLGREDISSEEFAWRSLKMVQFLIRDFANGQRYAMEKL